jgi:hypothetical protein
VERAAHWRPVGAILVANGSITQGQLDAALAEQARTGRKLGEILTSSGAITWLTLAEAIAEQATDLAPAAPAPPPPVPQPAPEPPVLPTRNESAAQQRLVAVEAMLKDRQRAFLELVSVTETLRSTISRLQEELARRDHELAHLRATSR